jgi:hypothetical protein
MRKILALEIAMSKPRFDREEKRQKKIIQPNDMADCINTVN